MKDNVLKRVLKVEISFCYASLFTILALYLLSFRKDVLDNNYILENFIYSPKYFVLEKTEFFQFILSFVLFILSFIFFRWVINKYIDKMKNNVVKLLFSVLNILLFFILIVLFYDVVIKNNSTIYYYSFTFIKNNALSKILFLIICFSLSILFSLISKIDLKNKFVAICKYIAYAIVICSSILVSYLYVAKTFAYNDLVLHHSTVLLHPIIKITSGLTPLVDFNSLYGGYAYFYALIIRIFNNDSFYIISMLISITVFISIMFLSIFTNKMIKNKVISLFVLLSIIVWSILAPIIKGGGIYPQYFPTRVLFPSMMLCYGCLYLNRKGTKREFIFWILGFVLSAIALFYNFESGLICLGSYMSLLGYELLCKYKFNNKQLYLGLAKIVCAGICSFVFYALITEIIVFVRTGSFVNIKTAMFGISTFFGTGFYMINMPIKHIWIFLALLVFVGISVSLNKIRIFNNKKQKNSKYSLLFFLCMYTVLVFSYYQGRSHNAVFFAVAYPCIILIGIYCDKLYEKILQKFNPCIKIISYLLATIFLAFLLNYAFTFLGLIKGQTIRSILNKDYIDGVADTHIKEKIEMFDTYTKDLPDLEYLCEFEAYWYDRYNKKDVKKLNDYADIFTYKDMHDIIYYLNNEKKDLVTSRDFFNKLNYKYSDEINKLTENGYKIYCNNYDLIFVYSDDDAIKNNKYLKKCN